MRIAKLFAYLAVGLLLPLWLYNFMDNDLVQQKLKDESRQLDNVKKQGQDFNIIFSHLQTEHSLQELIQLSVVNATTLQGILAHETISKSDISQGKSNDPSCLSYTLTNQNEIEFNNPIIISNQSSRLLKDSIIIKGTIIIDSGGKAKKQDFEFMVYLKSKTKQW